MNDPSRPAPDAFAPAPSGRRPGVDDYLLAMGPELRAPLNAVIGTSGLLLDGDLSDQQRQHVRSIHAAGESLATILNDLMDLSRLLQSGLPIEPIPFDLRSMVEETAKALSPRAEERGLPLRVDWRPDLPRHVVGDPGRTRQVLGNLVGHALNATSQGEVVIRASADGEAQGAPLIRFTVEDTGIGFPADRLDRVFDAYVPVDASPYRSFGVSGLGLRISAELVRLMGGEIGVESEVGTGSRFWFRLPLPVAEAGEELRLDHPRATRQGRILVVEADLASRHRLSEQLAAAGWSVAFADDLGEVYGLLREAHASGAPFALCMLSDYAVRPVHAELATRIKANPALAPTALVILTAVGSPGDGKKLWHAGFAAYLRRPVPTEELHDALLALSQLGDAGRGPALITRHSLAEARNSTPAQFEAIDEMLASLSAPDAPRALLVGATPAQQIDVTETLALAGLAVEMAAGTTEALDRLARSAPAIVILAREPDDGRPETYARLRQGPNPSGGQRPMVVFVDRPDRRDALLASGVDEVLLEPVRRSDLDRVIRRWTDRTPRPVSEEAPAAPLVVPEPPAPTSDRGAPVSDSSLNLEPELELERPETPDPSEVEVHPAPGFEPAGWDLDESPPAIEGFVPEEPGLGFAGDDADIEPIDLDAPGAELVLDREPAKEAAEASDDREAGPPQPVALLAAPAEPEPALELESPADLEAPNDLASLAELEPPTDTEAPVDLAVPAQPAAPPSAPADPEPAASSAAPDQLSGDGRPGPELDEEWDLDIADLAIQPELAALTEPAIAAGDLPAETLASDLESDIEASAPDPEPTNSSIEPAPAAVVQEEVGPADQSRAQTLAVVGEAILEQLASGSGIFAQQVAGSFLRDAPQRITELRSAASRGDPASMTQALQSLKAMGGLLGAARLVEVCLAMEAAMERGDFDAAAECLPDVNRGFLEARAVLERAAPPGAASPSELAPVSAAFLDQLRPERDATTRTLAKQVVATFRAEAPQRLAELKGAVRVQDAAAAQRLAQTLKGMCSLIGADPMAKLCALVEADARLRRVGRAGRYIDQLFLELDRVHEALAQAN